MNCYDDRRFDYKYKYDGYLDKRDYYRWDDYDRNRVGGRYDKDDFKRRKDKYSLSFRRGEECKRLDYRDF